MNRLNDALKGVKKYRKKAKEVKKEIKQKAHDYRTPSGYDWQKWKADLQQGAKELREEREKIKAENKALSEKERERRKQATRLWIDVIYYGLTFALKFIPLGAGASMVLKLIGLMRFYRKVKK